MALTRLEMVDIINAGGVVLFNGIRYDDPADLPTQEEIDIINQGGGGATVIFPDAIDVGNFPMDADGGIKVHVQNPSGGGGGTSGGLTDTELRANPIDVNVDFPTVQPVSDNGDSLTVDGSVAVSNFPATQPVSGTVAISNLPATQPISSSAIGATTDAEATGDGSLIAIIKRVRTFLSDISTLITNRIPSALGTGGGVKVDIVSGGASVTYPAPVTVFPAISRTGGAQYDSSTIVNAGYKGIEITMNQTVGSNAQVILEAYNEAKQGYGGTAMGVNIFYTANLTFVGTQTVRIYPGAGTSTAVSASGFAIPTSMNAVQFGSMLPTKFRISLIHSSGTSTTRVDYQLIP